MLLSEIIYNAKNLISGGIQSDDMNLSDTQLAFIIDYYRAKLFKQKQDRGTFDKQLYTQNLGHVDLIQADKNLLCGVSQCIIRTKFKVPKPMSAKSITFVGLINGEPFQMSYHNTIKWELKDKWTAKEPKWYYQSGYIYLVNIPTTMLEIINIQGIFERPLLVEKFNTSQCEDDDCSNVFNEFNFEYPIPANEVDVILKLITETEFRLLMTMPTDITNDGLDKLAENGNS